MEKRRAYPAGLTRARSGRKYRLDAGVKTSTIDTSEMSLQARRLADAQRRLLALAHATPSARFRFSRRSAAVAWECSRAASAASRFSPSGVSR